MGTVTLAAAIAQAEAEEAAGATQTWVAGDDGTTHNSAEEEAIDKTAVVMETRTTDTDTATATATIVVTSRPPGRPPKVYPKKRQKKPDWCSQTASKRSQQQGIPYTELVTNAILALQERTGSSHAAIHKWIVNNQPTIDPARLTNKMSFTFKNGVKKLRFLKIKASYTVNPAWLKAQKKKEAALARGSTTTGTKRGPYKKTQAQKKKEATPGKKRGPYKKKVKPTDITSNSPQPGKKRGPYKKKVTATTDTTSTSPQPGRPSTDTITKQHQRHNDDDEERTRLSQLVEQHAITIRNLERRLVTLEEAAAARTDRCANAATTTTTTTTTNEGTGEKGDETNGRTRSQNSSVVRHDLLLD